MSMIRSSIGRRTTDGSSGAAALEFIAGAKGCFVRQIVISLAAATASTFGIGRPAALGITPTSPVTSLAELGDGVVTCKSAVAWGTGPTVPANFFRRVGFPATINSYQPFDFGSLYLAPNQSIVVWNLAANGVCDVTIIADEPIVEPTFS
jgi:hypothetical protein